MTENTEIENKLNAPTLQFTLFNIARILNDVIASSEKDEVSTDIINAKKCVARALEYLTDVDVPAYVVEPVEQE